MSTLFLTGGSGFLGQHLIRQLRGAGHAVRALARSAASRALVEAAGASAVDGDLDATDRLGDALAGVDAVFHVAADTNTWSRHNLRQVARRPGISPAYRACVIPASRVESYLVTGVLTEDGPRRGRESWINYERTKAAGEDAVRAVADAATRPAHMVRPPAMAA